MTEENNNRKSEKFMDTGSVEVEVGAAQTPDQQYQHLRRQMESLYQNLRTARHAINNDVAVIMAMAELSQRNPAQSAKLAQLCLEKSPQITATISGFAELFNGTLSMHQEPRNP